ALSREIHDIPDWGQLINTAFFDIGSQPRMPGIGVANPPVGSARENGYCRILVPFFVLAAEIVLKRARSGTQKSQSVPSSIASVQSQARQICSGNNSEIQILSQMMRDATEAINPRCTHRARRCLLLAEHEVIE